MAMRLIAPPRYRARKFGYAFNLTWQDIYPAVLEGTCRLTGIPFNYEWNGPGTNPYAPSVDRIDSSKDYTRDNVRLILWAVNRALGEWGDDVFAHIADEFNFMNRGRLR